MAPKPLFPPLLSAPAGTPPARGPRPIYEAAFTDRDRDDLAWFRSNPSKDLRVRPFLDGDGTHFLESYIEGRAVWMVVVKTTYHGRPILLHRACLRPEPGEETNPWMVLRVNEELRWVRYATWKRIAVRLLDADEATIEAEFGAVPDGYQEFLIAQSAEVGNHCAYWARRGAVSTRPLRGMDFAEGTEFDLNVHVIGAGRALERDTGKRPDPDYEPPIPCDETPEEDDPDPEEERASAYTNMIGRAQHLALRWEVEGGVVYRPSADLLAHLVREDLELEDGPFVWPRSAFAIDLSCAPAELRAMVGPADLQALLVSEFRAFDTPIPDAALRGIEAFWTAVDDLGNPRRYVDLTPELRTLRDELRSQSTVPGMIAMGLGRGPERHLIDYGCSEHHDTWLAERNEIRQRVDPHNRAARRLILHFCYLHALRVRTKRPWREPKPPAKNRPSRPPGRPSGGPSATTVGADATIMLPRMAAPPPASPSSAPSTVDRSNLVEARVTRVGHTRNQAYGPGRSLRKEITIPARPDTKVYRRPDKKVRRVNVLLNAPALNTPKKDSTS